MTSLATVMMSAALFSRKSRSGWLDELDEIRGAALVSPDGEVDVLMEPVPSLAATGLDRPINWQDPSELEDLAPAPHRVNPAEMWHPEVVVPGTEGDLEPAEDEEVLDPEDLLLPSGRPAAFRFSTFSTGDGLHVDDGLAGGDAPAAVASGPTADHPTSAIEAPIPTPIGEPVIEEGAAWSPRSIALPGEPLAMGEPLPIVFVPQGGTGFENLVSDPVGRRAAHQDDHPVRGNRPLGLAGAPSPLDEIVPAAAPTAWPVPVDDDGTVVLRAGILRLGPGVHSEVRHDSGRVRVELPAAWCWATLGHESEPVTVSLPSGTVALEPGTTALVTVEGDASAFVAVASGHAVLVEPHGSTALPAGTVALSPVGGPAQVDHASLVEIDADPLVALNRDLDTRL